MKRGGYNLKLFYTPILNNHLVVNVIGLLVQTMPVILIDFKANHQDESEDGYELKNMHSQNGPLHSACYDQDMLPGVFSQPPNLKGIQANSQHNTSPAF